MNLVYNKRVTKLHGTIVIKPFEPIDDMCERHPGGRGSPTYMCSTGMCRGKDPPPPILS